MPWAAAVKVPLEQQQHHQHSLMQQHSNAPVASLATTSAFGDSATTMGSWTSPDTGSTARSGWNADGSMKHDTVPDDGTAIWGNPSTKKTGIDWTEKESMLNPPQTNNNSEKRIQKPEPIISSLNGTEAWGAPATSGGGILNNGGTSKANNSQQLAKSSENSGNNYVGKVPAINNEPLSWGESSSLQQKVTAKNVNSSPTSDSVWNHLTSNNENNSKRKTSTDWLTSSVNSNNSSSSRIDELNKQLESTSIFDGESPSSVAKSASSITGNNSNLDNGRQTSILGGTNGAGTIGAGLVGSGGGISSNAINDLKQHMSANFSNDPLDPSPSRQTQAEILSPNNQMQSQLNPYSLGITPSRELLKQMVHQIQLAVQAGHLNAHIMNQPLSTPTLQLVYTLLQQIKLLQQFQEIRQRTQTVNKTSDISNNVTQQSNLDLQIARVQQNISLLQKAITQQQAALTKNESIVESTLKQQAANNSYNSSYANISKLSTNMKVPSNDPTISTSNNIDSFRRSSLIDTLSNNNSYQLRSEAQARFEANNANLDKNLSPLLQSSSSLNNVLNNKQQSDFSKAQSFSTNQTGNQQQQTNKGNLSTTQASTSPAAAAWLAFTQGDLANSQSSPSSTGASWSRSGSSEQQFNEDLLSELSAAKAWQGAGFMSSDTRDSSGNHSALLASSVAPGVNLARSSSEANGLKQPGENDFFNSRDPSIFYDWNSSNQSGDSIKRNLDVCSSSSPFSPAIGGLSLQSNNPWLFAPTSSSSLGIGNSGLDNLIGANKNATKIKDIGNMDKMRISGDHLGFYNSNSATSSAHRALYNLTDLSSSAGPSQFNNDNNPIISNKQTATSGSGSTSSGNRPGPPPGLRGNLGLLGSSFSDGITSILESPNDKPQSGEESQQIACRESSSSLWSGAWFD